MGALIVALFGAAVAMVAAVVVTQPKATVERPSAAGAAGVDQRFRVVLADGQALTLADLRGKPTVAGFVIENCLTCIPTLKTLAALERDGVNAVAVNVNTPDQAGAPAAVRRLAEFAKATDASGALYAADPGSQTASALGVRQLESFVIFDADGREIGRGVNLDAEAIRSTLEGA